MADSLEKREELYKRAVEYKRTRDEAIRKNEYLEDKLKDLKFAQNDIEEMRRAVVNRDIQIKQLSEKIRSLQNKTEFLSQNTSQQEEFTSKNETYSKDPYLAEEIYSTGITIIKSIQTIPTFQFAFKKIFSHSTNFQDLLKDRLYEKAILKTLKFIEELIQIEKFERRNKNKSIQSEDFEIKIEKPETVIYTTASNRSYNYPISPISTETPHNLYRNNSHLSTSMNEENYHKLMNESQTLLDSLSEQNTRISKLNQQISQTMNYTNKPLPNGTKNGVKSSVNNYPRVQMSDTNELREQEIKSTSTLISPKASNIPKPSAKRDLSIKKPGSMIRKASPVLKKSDQ